MRKVTTKSAKGAKGGTGPNIAERLFADVLAACRKAQERGDCTAQVISGGIWMTVLVGANCTEIPSSKVEWRRCEEEFPVTDLTVIVFCPKSEYPIWLAYFDPQTGYWHDITHGVIEGDEEPTHWGHLPLAPIDPKRKAVEA